METRTKAVISVFYGSILFDHFTHPKQEKKIIYKEGLSKLQLIDL
jgi:hypothetical protein